MLRTYVLKVEVKVDAETPERALGALRMRMLQCPRDDRGMPQRDGACNVSLEEVHIKGQR